MAEQTNEHQPLLNKSNDEEAESDPEQPPRSSHSEEDSAIVAAPENAETTPAILEEGTFVLCDG